MTPARLGRKPEGRDQFLRKVQVYRGSPIDGQNRSAGHLLGRHGQLRADWFWTR